MNKRENSFTIAAWTKKVPEKIKISISLNHSILEPSEKDVWNIIILRYYNEVEKGSIGLDF